MNFELIQCDDLQQAIHIPNTTDDSTEETWFVKFGDEIVGVGVFPRGSTTCALAMVGESYEDRRLLGSVDDHDAVLLQGLEIAYEGYLRSIRGDVVIGNKPIDE
ncbi:hypothetical protein [Sphingobacterium griseoflavum]|uniref:Uncharacterized protein n=1 Tax=Sphingobacterium griseoflavum TaxID=1474952 RepID=A0ABQ3I0D6_9SPHI|nr:hypothetical protein [Sphingobacterium griseoflavum]GHE41944.1 hypothetical protein GCM10017764_26480 [Sphingobacterium griseoflavum]